MMMKRDTLLVMTLMGVIAFNRNDGFLKILIYALRVWVSAFPNNS